MRTATLNPRCTTIARRTLLRGVGVTMALPWLESLSGWGGERNGQAGLRDYLREKRQGDFVDNLCRKLFSYALGRGLLASDQKAIDEMRSRLTADGCRFDGLVESIVTTPQFLNKRGRDDPQER